VVGRPVYADPDPPAAFARLAEEVDMGGVEAVS
jgi:orotidine-5'-phosphate decarboxylase